MSNRNIRKPGRILETIGQDGLDRRGLLRCMAWAGAGVLWTVSGGVPRSLGIGDAYAKKIIDGIIESVSIDFDLFAANGTPLRAKMGVAIKEQDAKYGELLKLNRAWKSMILAPSALAAWPRLPL